MAKWGKKAIGFFNRMYFKVFIVFCVVAFTGGHPPFSGGGDRVPLVILAMSASTRRFSCFFAVVERRGWTIMRIVAISMIHRGLLGIPARQSGSRS